MAMRAEHGLNSRSVKFRTEYVDGIGAEQLKITTAEDPVPEPLEFESVIELAGSPQQADHFTVSTGRRLQLRRPNLREYTADNTLESRPVEFTVDAKPIQQILRVEKEDLPLIDTAGEFGVRDRGAHFALECRPVTGCCNHDQTFAAFEAFAEVISYIRNENVSVGRIELKLVTAMCGRSFMGSGQWSNRVIRFDCSSSHD